MMRKCVYHGVFFDGREFTITCKQPIDRFSGWNYVKHSNVAYHLKNSGGFCVERYVQTKPHARWNYRGIAVIENIKKLDVVEK